MDTNTVILRVQLDEADTEKRLGQLVLDIEANRKAQQALNAERKAGQVTDEQFSQQTVKLTNQLTLQRAEQRSLTKDLDLYRTATGELANTYKGTQAQLSLAQNQFKLLDGSQNNSSKSAQELGKTIDGLRNTLRQTDETQSLFVRNLGNYPKPQALEPLIQQLVLLQEQLKLLPADSAAAVEGANRVEAGFKQLGREAAAQGKSLDDVENKLKTYGEAIRPANAELAKLTIAQDEVAKSAGKDSIAYAEVGFKIGQAQKAISEIPAELAKVPTAAETASKSMLDAFKSNSLYADSIGKAQKFVGQFRTGLDVLKGGFKGVQAGEEAATEGSKVLKIGLAEIGIGLLILAFTTLVSYFTQSAEGMKILSGLSSALGATFQVLTDIVSGTGRAIALLFQGDFKGAGEQIAKQFDGVGNKILTAAKNGYQLVAMEKDLAKARRELEVEDVKEQSRVAVLLRLSKERGKTSAEQLAALKEAGEIEASVTQKNIDQQQKELDLINLKIKLKGSASKGDLLQQQADAQKAIEQSLAAQQETNAKIKVRQSVFLEEQRQRGLDDNKAYYDARAAQAVKGTQAEADARVQVLLAERQKQLGAIGLTENQKQAIIKNSERAIKDVREQYAQQALTQIAQLEQLALDRRLQRVKAGSEEELTLQREKLTVQYNLDIRQAGLTLRGKLILQQKYQADVLKLEQDAAKQQVIQQLQNASELLKTKILGQRADDAETLRLQTEQLENQRQLAIAGLDKRADNEAKIAAINAQAAQQRQKLEYDEANRLLAEYLDKKKQAIELDHVNGTRKGAEYQRQLAALERAGLDAQIQLTADYEQDNAAILKKGTDFEIAQRQRATEDKKKQEETKQQIQDASFQAAAAGTDLIIDLFGKESAAGEAALITKKTLAIAEIAINLQKQLSANATYAATLGPLGPFYLAATDALAIVGAAASTAAVLKLQRGGLAHVGGGGVAVGASHDAGGIPLYYRGRAAGIEIEGGEPVLTAAVSRNPLLLSLASFVNQAAGGRALEPGPHLAAGGLALPLTSLMRPIAYEQLRGGMQPIDYEQLAQATARALRKSPPITQWVDFKAAQQRNAFTDSLGSA